MFDEFSKQNEESSNIQLCLPNFSIPSSFKQIKHEKDYVKEGRGKNGTRRIFHSFDFDEYEVLKLERFETLLRNNVKTKIYLEEHTKEEILKVLYAAKFDFNLAQKVFSAIVKISEYHKDQYSKASPRFNKDKRQGI